MMCQQQFSLISLSVPNVNLLSELRKPRVEGSPVKFPNDGSWRGSIPSWLSRVGIFERIGDTNSDRPSRPRGDVLLWRIRDPEKANRETERLSKWLDAIKENPLSATTDAGEIESNDTNSINSNGDKEHAAN